MLRDVTVVIPSIPERTANTLQRALASVWAQTHPPECVIIEVDWQKYGAGPTRTRGLSKVVTTWVAYLDDDDEFCPHHLTRLLDVAEDTAAHVIVPWFTVANGRDPFPKNRAIGVPETGPMPAFPVTVLAQTAWAQQGYFPKISTIAQGGDEYTYFTMLRDAGARFVMIPDETWIYHHHFGNTSGLPQNRSRRHGETRSTRRRTR